MEIIYWQAVLVSLLAFLSVVRADLCKSPSESALALHMTTGSAPKAGTAAGVYQKISGISEFGECVKACCEDTTCSAVFFTQQKCLTIQCKSDDGCAPGPKSATLTDAYLINLRSVAETASVDDTTPTLGLSQGENADTGGGVLSPPALSHHPLQSCEVALYNCPLHEICTVSSERSFKSKNGVCQCIKGYTRNSTTGACEKPSTSVNTTDTENKTVTTTSTTKKGSTTEPPTTLLTVSAGENRVLTFPDNSVKLTAYALPVAATGEKYTYHWTLDETPTGDDIGQTTGIDEQTVSLTKLIPGHYVLRVEVKGPHKTGSSTVNVTVLPESKENVGPVAVIKPDVLNIKEDTTGILDGADSRDDTEVTKYLWEVVSGPITEGFHLENNEGSMLKLKDLAHGEYTIRLTVSDAQGVTNFTTATVNVAEAVDYPPNANAGDDKIVTLPETSVNLYANASSDDKGIVSYEWKPTTEGFSADVDGAHEPVLKVAHLREGAYTFQLTVTDTKGQQSTAEVHVYVKSSQNKPPVAAVTTNFTTATPGTDVVLDGSPSSDDQLITKYQWTQVSGPNSAQLSNADRAKANVEGLEKGDYIFKLSVSDAEDLHNSTTVHVKVQEHSNAKPVARAGENFEVTLPIDMVRIDGSKSTDDGGPLKYLWTKGDESPGAGDVLNGSNKRAILLLTNVVSGSYTFSLRVTDQEGQQAEDSVTVTVHEDPDSMNLVELSLDTLIESFTEKHKKNLATQLALMLPSDTAVTETKVEITGIHQDYHSGKLAVLFLVKDYQGSTEYSVRNGTTVKSQIQDKLDRDSVLIGFTVSKVDTVVCQNDCSGHGYCDAFSKQCVCETFWMPNYAKVSWNGVSNCDWSILYVVVITVGSIFVSAVLIWLCVCCSRRCKRTRGRRKHTYKLLQDIEDMEAEEREAKKKKRSNITAGSGSIFMSETDGSSEGEDTLFMNGKIGNGGVNINRSQDDLVKANNLKNKFSKA